MLEPGVGLQPNTLPPPLAPRPTPTPRRKKLACPPVVHAKQCSSWLQVSPRPVLTNVALQVPVLAADASSAQLEADLLKGNLQLTHTRLQLADLVGLLPLTGKNELEYGQSMDYESNLPN